MDKILVSQSSVDGEKGELDEFLGNIKFTNRARYITYGSVGLIFLALKLLGVFSLPWLMIFLLFLMSPFVFICDLFIRKTKPKESITKKSLSYFILQLIESIIILLMLHSAGTTVFFGAFVLVIFLFATSFFAYTRGGYRWGGVAFCGIGYTVVIILEYLGVFEVKDFFNIGVTIKNNPGLLVIGLFSGAFGAFFLSFVVNYFSRRLLVSLRTLSLREKELAEAKQVLEIKVKARTEELEMEKASLEERVKERTVELQEKIKEFEKFQKLVVGRELRMVVLKKEIEELKKELENKKTEFPKVENK